jgi:hypothetical protein
VESDLVLFIGTNNLRGGFIAEAKPTATIIFFPVFIFLNVLSPIVRLFSVRDLPVKEIVDK